MKRLLVYILILSSIIAAFFIGKDVCRKKYKLCLNCTTYCPSFPEDKSRLFDLDGNQTLPEDTAISFVGKAPKAVSESIAVDSAPKPTLKIKLENFGGSPNLDVLPMIKDALSELYDIQYVNEEADTGFDVVIEGVSSGLSKDAKKQYGGNVVKIFYAWEPITPDIANYDLAIGFDFIDSPKYIRVPLYYVFYRNQVSTDFDRGECRPQEKPYFACFLITNYGYHNGLEGCDARNHLFHKLSLYKKVQSGGKALNNIGQVVPYADTLMWSSRCKFMIAYENTKHDGYMTEKPFQAYIGGTVPIWYGDRNALQTVNPKALIYSDDFANEDAMIEYIKKLDNDDDLYCKVWNERIITNKDDNYPLLKAKLKKKLKEVIQTKLQK